MPISDDIQEIIDAAAAIGPQEVTTAAGTVKQFSLKDLIELTQVDPDTNGLNRAHRGLRFSKLVPPGTSP